MSTPWFARTFAPVQPESLDLLLERLRGTPARLEERLAGLRREVLTARHDASWSIQTNVGHLLDLEPLWRGRVDDFVDGRGTLRPADLENRATHDARHDERDPGFLLRDFRDRRGELVAALEHLSPELRRRTALHPRLQQAMTPADLAHFVAEHDDHHLARITELLRRTATPTSPPLREQLFMVVERFRPGCSAAVHRRFAERGRLAPAGLDYVASWVDLPYERCYQLMSTSDSRLFDAWIANWNDLVEFEVIPVLTSADAAKAMATHRD